MAMNTQFADDPSAYFKNSAGHAHQLSRRDQEELQLQGLRARFDAMRDRLPPLRALADAAGIVSIERIEDAVPLLFPHSFYKSYDEYLLTCGAYNDLTDWMQNFTLCDLSAVRERDFGSIDEWLDGLDAGTGIDPFHSSGTMGRLSFYPRGTIERAMHAKAIPMVMQEWTEPAGLGVEVGQYALVWPSYAGGRSALLRGGEMWRDGGAIAADQYHAMFPNKLSADWQYYVMRANNARAAGKPGSAPSDYVRERLAEGEAMMAKHDEYQAALLDKVEAGLGGYPAVLFGGPNNVHKLAAAGLERGMKSAFAPGSLVRCAGGFKGQEKPAKMEAEIKRFTGMDRMFSSYAMTELVISTFECREGRFHGFPWLIPFILDENTGALLPRQGVQNGRAAFVDLMAQTYWGGVISGDRVELSWEDCKCGRKSPHFGPGIDRIPQVDEDDHSFGAASPDAVHAALMSLRPR